MKKKIYGSVTQVPRFRKIVMRSRFMPHETTAYKIVEGKIKSSSTINRPRHVRRCEIAEANRAISVARTYQFYSISKAL